MWSKIKQIKWNDSQVILNSIIRGKANITLKSFYEKIITEEQIKPAANKTTTITTASEENKVSGPIPKEKTALHLQTYAITIIVTGLILFVIYWVVRIIRKRKFGYNVWLILWIKMRVLGFEPRYALSNVGLNDARLTTPAHPL